MTNLKTPIFSIVITCYKMEPYIKDVIKSVQQQNCDDFEIVVVNDGSPDKCKEIIDGCAVTDSRIKAIHRVNGGPGAARNSGVLASSGEYIFFLDGDDRMCENVLGQVSGIISKTNPDIIASTEHIYTNWERSYIRKNVLGRDINHLKLDLACDTYLAHNFYRREMIVSNNRPFGEVKKLAEDQEWLLNNVHCAENIELFEGAFYYHFEARPDSQVNGFSDEKIIPTVLTWAKMFHDIDVLNYNKPEIAILKHRTSSVFLKTLVVNTLKTKNAEIKKQCYQIFKDNYDVVTSEYNKLRIVGKISKVIGVKLTFNLCGVYYRLKKQMA